MRALALFLALLLGAPAYGQPVGTFAQSAPSGGYTGPFNIITSSKLGGYSTRLLSSSYTGKALSLCTGSATTGCADVGFDTSTHSLKASDITGQGCTLGSTCTVAIWYDQSGGGSGGGGTASGNDLVPLAAGDRPILTSNCPSSGLYCLTFSNNSGNGTGLGNGSGWSPASVSNATFFTVMSVASTGQYANNVRFLGISMVSGEQIRIDTNTGTAITGCLSTDHCLRIICFAANNICGGTDLIGAASDAAVHQDVFWYRNNSTNTLGEAIDQATPVTLNDATHAGVTLTGVCLGNNANSTTAGCTTSSALPLVGNIEEFVMFSADESSAISGAGTVSANQRSFWGTP